MKKYPVVLILVMAAVLCFSAAATADGQRVILYSVLKEKTEDGSTGISLCCIDADGELWSLEAADAEEDEEILQLLQERRGMKSEGKITGSKYGGKYVDRERIKELAVMAETVEKAAGVPEETGAGIGEYSVYAVQYDPDGNPEPVLLGVSGDAVFENTDPGAQALYRVMTYFQCFGLPCGFAEEGLTPHGFTMVTAREFFHLENVNAETAAITAVMTDCEEGYIDIRMTDEDRRKVTAILERGVVIGKENPWLVTGGTMRYIFRDENGEYLGTIETYEEDGLAVAGDGMYRLALLPESTEGLGDTEQQLLHLKINGADYQLGRSTPRDLIRNGWYCYIENDGSFAFTDDEGYGTFYARTYGGGVDEPIKTIDCQFAYTISFEYCGFDGYVDPYNLEDMDTIWYLRELEELRAKYPDEEFMTLEDLKERDPDDDDDDGPDWGGMKLWMKTLGEEEKDMDNGTGVSVTLSDGHTLWMFSASSPVSLSLGHEDYIRLGPEED